MVAEYHSHREWSIETWRRPVIISKDGLRVKDAYHVNRGFGDVELSGWLPVGPSLTIRQLLRWLLIIIDPFILEAFIHIVLWSWVVISRGWKAEPFWAIGLNH